MQKRFFLLQILLLAQRVSGITMPIIRSSRVLYSGCCLWYFVLWFFQVAGLVWSWGLCVRFAGCSILHQVGFLFPHINEDARSKSHQICNFNIHHSSVVTNSVEINCNPVDFLNFICFCSFEDCLYFHMKTKKVKFTLEQAMKAQRGVEV